MCFPPGVLRDPDLCARRAILSTLNVNVKEINGRILDLMDGRIHELRSADTVDREDDDGLDVDVNLLNQATGKGVPDHVLRLKVGSVCLIMRNLNIGDGLVNGTKVIVTAISSRLITVRLIGNTQPIGIPRITFRFAFAEGSPLRVCRRQFPLMLAYCMTGHKSQGQTIEYVGVDLRTDCFTHGQLYVLLSRVRRPDDIVVLVPDDRIVEGVAYAKNIVYDELLLNTD
ncbi:ATP-dependent DNA helicase PIF1-like [Homalodisca vitripennis]|uniref:ATP-dependent DNA helicase PIF1-like n=1 Tax=Homalodisca vitripennis TaxID=197043 RepID=UPI001EEAF528|nr:ATP-dependent DNA helicase PIF1-like [Homalodisca vitripennis]